MNNKPLFLRSLPAGLLALVAIACSEPTGTTTSGLDLDALFAPPTASEISAISAEWAARDPRAVAVQVEVTDTIMISDLEATVRVVSHAVDGARHFGGILVPNGTQPGSLPIVIFAHGGDGGVDLDDTFALLPFVLGSSKDDFVFVIPSFRSEPLIYNDMTFLSEGDPSPWDRDVDDALALIDVALELAPEADSARIAILGFSRGAGVGLLMAERDPRIDIVVEFFGPTDFFDRFVRDIVEEALRGELRDLPGLDHLNDRFIQPLGRGELTIAQVRPELLRRSAVYFADRLPQLQVHHGTADMTVEVIEAERLIEVMQGLGRGEPDFEFFLYDGGGHDPLTLPGSLPRARSFIERLISQLIVFADD